eukprot:TRINITY_DN18225_c0_g2_i1.p1 TRINITY_DN18225_c0_g2~~TRINITY_DN18225_c0_g2_i1.p1  ORF type:complete len:199 (-),score=53.83 TRINITY_DN18225_c0_g2_i1:59-655(-)
MEEEVGGVEESWEGQLRGVVEVMEFFKVPQFPHQFFEAVKERKLGPLQISLIINSDDWVRFGLLMPSPTERDIVYFAEVLKESPKEMLEFMRKVEVGVHALEMFYLNPPFGYEVYNEGWNFCVYFKVAPQGTLYFNDCAEAWPVSHVRLPLYFQWVIECCCIASSKETSITYKLPQDLIKQIIKWVINIIPSLQSYQL